MLQVCDKYRFSLEFSFICFANKMCFKIFYTYLVNSKQLEIILIITIFLILDAHKLNLKMAAKYFQKEISIFPIVVQNCSANNL